jgi:hypothetical protein
MTTLDQRLSLRRRPPGDGDQPDRLDRRVIPGLILVLAAVAGWRDGGFWHAEALAVALIAGVLLVVALVVAPPDRRSSYVIGSLGLLTVWWFIRSVTAGPGTDFLPLGASIVAFAASFAAVRPLPARGRETAALAMASLGAIGALVGFAGLIWRWFPLAMPAQGLWRLSSSLTYADAAGLALGVCLLLALGCARAPALVRVVVCLNLAGVLATQSRGALLAVACGCFFVPAGRFRALAVPLVAGLGLGVAAIGSSPAKNQVLWLAPVLVVVLVLAVILPAMVGREHQGVWSTPFVRIFLCVAALCAAIGVALVVHHEVGLRVLAPSDQDRAAEWSSGLHQWLSAPLTGVGPDRLLDLHASDGSTAHFVHDEYLQIAADAGLVGLGLLALVGFTLAKGIRRTGPLSSCAVGAIVCWSVGGALDFSWHLPVLGLLGGWCAGLTLEGGSDQ